jgi:hypothetical protein
MGISRMMLRASFLFTRNRSSGGMPFHQTSQRWAYFASGEAGDSGSGVEVGVSGFAVASGVGDSAGFSGAGVSGAGVSGLDSEAAGASAGLSAAGAGASSFGASGAGISGFASSVFAGDSEEAGLSGVFVPDAGISGGEMSRSGIF